MARVTGLEPATSGVTGRHSNQLSYTRVSSRFRALPRGEGRRLGGAALACQADGAAYFGERRAVAGRGWEAGRTRPELSVGRRIYPHSFPHRGVG